MKRTIDEKLSIIKLLKDGASIMRLAKEYHASQSTILMWARRYDKYGIDGLKPMSHAKRNVPVEVREEILRQYFEESIPLQWLAITTRISDHTIGKWVNEAVESGRWVGHGKHRRGKPIVNVGIGQLSATSCDIRMPQRTKLQEDESEQKRGAPPKNMGKKNWKKALAEMTPLERENLRLRAENELLKKVQALVLEKKMSGNGHKPSTN